MSDIPQQLVNSILVKCGRRCCVCRRFRPTKLQVHHIQARSKGGTDAEDNLMPICLPCHTDVHSHVPFARRFTADELKAHRDALFRAVEEGRLPPDEEDNTAELDRQVVGSLVAGRDRDEQLLPAAVELLLAAAHADGSRQGVIVISETNSGIGIYPGNRDRLCAPGDRRCEALYLAGIQELEDTGLLESRSDSMRMVTHFGYVKADEILAEHGQKAE